MVQATGSRTVETTQVKKPAEKDGSLGRDRREAAGQSEMRIGSKLKHGRLLKGLTLKELAEIVGCSESMLSKLENDRLTPSISFLHRLASALDTSIAELYAETDTLSGPVHHFPSERRSRIVDDEDPDRGAWFERIIPIAKSGLLQANILNIPPEVASDGMVEHVGEELGYLIEGELDVFVDGQTYTMKAGDLLFFPSSLLHGYANRSSRVARILWVNTPPSL